MRDGPMFCFYGGKWRVAPRYPAPIHDTIIEPFAGGAGYALRHAHKRVILIEKDKTIAAVWRYLIGVSALEILSLPDVPLDGTVDDLTGLTQEQRWVIGFWLNKGSATPCKRPSAWMRSGKSAGWWGPTVRAQLAQRVERIRHWCVIEGGYDSAPDEIATWYIDPPYSGAAGRHYRERNIDYTALAAWAQARRGQLIVCEAVGATWLPFEPFVLAQTNPSARGKAVSNEAIYYRPGLTPDPR